MGIDDDWTDPENKAAGEVGGHAGVESMDGMPRRRETSGIDWIARSGLCRLGSYLEDFFPDVLCGGFDILHSFSDACACGFVSAGGFGDVFLSGFDELFEGFVGFQHWV